MVQGYLSGNTECQMALNDRKLAAERRNNPSGMFLPPTKDFVEMNNVEFHSATNRAVFEETRLVRFACIQGLRFEALRFQVIFTSKFSVFHLAARKFPVILKYTVLNH